VWWVREPLRADAMRAAAAALVGRHDFASFCERAAEQSSTLVEVGAAEVAEEGALILVRLQASHFLWKMVRRVVGTLVRVGAGEVSETEFRALLAGGVPPRAGKPAQWTAPPSGLFLERVVYAGEPPPGPLRAVAPVGCE
jgi:tRNA pseudouridine38-40 synthase